jgi:hypothetical protein
LQRRHLLRLQLQPRTAADLSEAADKVGYFLDTVELLLLSLECECILRSAYLAQVGARGVEEVPLVVRHVVGRLRVRSVSICTFAPVKPLNRVPDARALRVLECVCVFNVYRSTSSSRSSIWMCCVCPTPARCAASRSQRSALLRVSICTFVPVMQVN